MGDLPTDALVARIRQSFGSWRAPEPAVPRRPFGAPDPKRAEDVLVLPERALTSQVQVCRVSPAEVKDTDEIARLRRRSARAAWTDILGQRLTAIESQPNSPFLGTQIQADNDLKELKSTCLVATFGGDAWAPALRALQSELQRFQTYGPSQAELDGTIDEARSTYRGAASQAPTRRSDDLAARLARDVARGDTPQTPAEAFRAYDTAVETLTPDEVKSVFQKDWSGGGPMLTVLSPMPPAADEVRRAWAYRNFGKPGSVVARDASLAQGVIRLRFANGVVLNFKQTAFEADSVVVRVQFGAGRREIANEDYFAAVMGGQLLSLGGLGRHSYAEIAQIFRDSQWSANLAVGDDAFILSGKTFRTGLERQLQIMAAFLTDPGFRPDLDARLTAALDTFYRVYRTNLALVLGQALTEAVAPAPLGRLPPESRLRQLRMADFGRVLKPALTSAPLEVTIVGDVDEKSATNLVAQSFGALPPRSTVDRGRADTWFLRFPQAVPPVVRATHEGSRDRAMVGVAWPLYVASPARRREEIALNVLDRAFSDLLRRRVRVELGKAYSPEAELSMPDYADQGRMVAVVETSPAEVDDIVSEIRKLAARLAGGDLPDDVVEAARAPLLAALESGRRENAFWAAGLNGSARRDPQLADFLGTLDLVRSVTPSEVRKAAADWLSGSPLVAVALPAPATTAGAAGGAKP